MTTPLRRAALCLLAVLSTARAAAQTVPVYGDILDYHTGKPIPARLYLRGADGKWYFPKSVPPYGSAVRYERKSGFNTNCVEFHTTLSAHQWVAELPPGDYTAIAERGKEWSPRERYFTVKDKPVEVEFNLTRLVNMAELGWFSGDAHNHRAPAELESAMLAEDVNVALPMIDWTTVDTMPPVFSDRNMKGSFGAKPVFVDPTHVWYPRNTEYEIFRSGGKAHTLGAFLIVGHKERFDIPVFPLRRVSERAHAEGGLIDLEKHNWNWSMPIVPVLKPDLFELANNHHWRAGYGVSNWAVPAPKWMRLAERGLGNGSGTDTEQAWTHYGFETYYALLNCGFRLKPSAGTANGVHPVPLGDSRVYVHCEGGFSYEKWMKGLGEGKSFVTTGPMVVATVNDQPAGSVLRLRAGAEVRMDFHVWVSESLELVVEVVQNGKSQRVDLRKPGPHSVIFKESGWLAMRVFDRHDNGRDETGRTRFAHTAPWWVEIEGKPLRPRREQADWFVQRTEEEIARNTGVLSKEQLDEFHEALAAWKKIQATAQ